MTTIIFQGFFGHENLGDDLILKVILDEIKHFPKIKIKIFTSNPQKVKYKFRVEAIDSRFNKWKLLRLIKQIMEILRSKLVILGGGGILKDYGTNSDQLENWLKFIRIAQIFRKKTALFGIGVENIRYKKSKEILLKTLKYVNFIGVRDLDSKKLLKKLGVKNNIRIMSDLTILLSNNLPNFLPKLKIPPRVIINVRYWYDKGLFIKNPYKFKNFLISVAEIADYLIQEYDASVDFLPMRISYRDNDTEIAKKVINHMKYKNKVNVLNYITNLSEFMHFIKNYDIVLGMRLHSLITASSIGIPIIGFSYMPKVKYFMNSINQSNFCFDLNDFDKNKIINAIDFTFNNYNLRSKNILEKIEELKKLTSRRFNELLKIAKS